MLLAVPAVLPVRTTLSPASQRRLVSAAAGSVGLALTLLLVHACQSLPLDRLDPASPAALAACGATLIIVYARVAAVLLTRR